MVSLPLGAECQRDESPTCPTEEGEEEDWVKVEDGESEGGGALPKDHAETVQQDQPEDNEDATKRESESGGSD